MPTPIHLVVIHHGLWGTSENTSYLTTTLAKYHGGLTSPTSTLTPPESPDTISVHSESHPNNTSKPTSSKLVVLNASSNSGDRTYDGVDWCGERLTKEVYEEVKRLEEEGEEVGKLSLIGYSLGGLVVRYAAGLMWADGFFEGHKVEGGKLGFKSRPKAASLSTIATPHLGVTLTRSTFSKVAKYVGSNMLGRSGRQLYLADRGWVPPDGSDQDLCLLEALVHPAFSFLSALRSFERIDIYANAVADLTVSYRTAAFEEHDPFLAPPSHLKLDRDPDHPPLLTSYESAEPVEEKKSMWKKVGEKVSTKNLPWILNPHRNPFRFPLNYLAVVCLPVVLPVMLGLVLHKLRSDSKGSNKRVREFERLWGVEHGHLPTPDSPSTKQKTLDRATLDGLEKKRVSRLLSSIEAEAEEAVREIAEDDVETSPPSSSSPSTLSEGENGDGRYVIKENNATLSLSETYPIQKEEVPLTETQLRIASRLNDQKVLPQVKKHLAHFDDVLNAHAVIIVRTRSMEAHQKGVPLIKAFVQQFGV